MVPSDSSATLNRISGGVSTISGSVESNGTVYFSNPNGLVFDATSRVTANGFVATTGTISNFDFMNRGEFSNHHANQVTLNGAISAPSITVQSGTVTVGGNLSAGSGKILLSSSQASRPLAQGATIPCRRWFKLQWWQHKDLERHPHRFPRQHHRPRRLNHR